MIGQALSGRKGARWAAALMLATLAWTPPFAPARSADGQVATGQVAEGRVLDVGMTAWPASLHPGMDAQVAKTWVTGLARRPMVAFDADWSLVCQVCAEVPTFANGGLKTVRGPDGTVETEVRLRLRGDLRWGDGTPVGAGDVRFGWEVGRDPRSGYANQELYTRVIRDVVVLDPGTVLLRWAGSACRLDELADFQILPAHLERTVWEGDPAAYPTRSLYAREPGNPGLWFGPWLVQAVDPGATLRLVANPHWSGGAPKGISAINVRVMENQAALEQALRTGQVDLVPAEAGLSIAQAERLGKEAGAPFRVMWKPTLSYVHIALNLDNQALGDGRVRRALLAAINRDEVVRSIYEGRASVAHHPVHPANPVHVPGILSQEYDPALAARLLDEAGWTPGADGLRRDGEGRPLRLEVLIAAGSRTGEMALQYMQDRWRALGVDARITTQPARLLFGETLVQRRFEGGVLFAFTSSPGSIPRASLHSSNIVRAENGWAGQNFTGYASAAMDGVLDGMDSACAPEAAAPLWSALQQTYATDLPSLPLLFPHAPHLVPAGLDGFVPTGHQHPATFQAERWSWR